MRCALPAAVVVALVLVAPAGASTVRVGTTGAVDYAAAPGEVNVLAASASGSTVTLTDDGATIAPGAGCSPVSAHQATCDTTGGFPALSADLGDGDDRASVSGLLSAVIDGGDGNDVLTGGEAHDVLEGGPGDDQLSGGGADDALFGDGPGLVAGSGADRLNGGAGADTLDCGAGDDTDVDGESADATDGCDQVASSAPPATPPPTTTTALEPTPPGSQARAADPLDPGVIVALEPAPAPTARPAAIVPVALTLTAPPGIARSTLRRTGLRLTVRCSISCRPTLALRRGTRTLTRRTLSAGTTTKAVRLRARTTARSLVLRVTAPDVTTRTRRVRVR